MDGTDNEELSPDQILARLRLKENFEDLGRGASDDEICDVERTLQVALPHEYRDFLSRCGYMFWFGISIFGIAPSHEDSVVHWTLKARNDDLPPGFRTRPLDAVVVHDYGGGGYYFLFDRGSSRRGQVALITDDALGGEVMSYPSFWAFLRIFV